MIIMGGEEEPSYNSQQFHNTVRENIIFLIFFLTLLSVSSMLIDVFSIPSRSRANRKSPRGPRNNTNPTDDDDESVVVNMRNLNDVFPRSSWLCVLTLCTSIGAILLLPISILSNEVLLLYPTNEYLEWLNGMLIQGLWTQVFLFSNIGLFFLLPFAHLFIEAEGFSGNKRGLGSKLYETIVILVLILFTVSGISAIATCMFYNQSNAFFHWNQLPFIYSCISFIGVLVLTLCTPLGVSHLFTVLSANFVLVPEFLRNVEEEYVCAVLEHENLKNERSKAQKLESFNPSITFRSTTYRSVAEFDKLIANLNTQIAQLESHRTTPPWKRNILYPGLFLAVLAVTGLTVFIVMINFIKIVVGLRDLSLEVVAKETLPLGGSSLSFLGPSGAIFEIILVIYLMASSLIGLYTLPVFRSYTPKLGTTPTSHLISNCAVLLVLSSALPVLMRILGLTNFDLLGTYAGKIEWIENNLIVVFVNLLFTVLTCVCLLNKVTRKISHEVYTRLKRFFYKD
ncbi:Protein LMBR1L [Orchesella cincta]|uniref:Protein LMBR1L n=1 Tax=Orchesella cincta TaxID=48709 RepID=A0A1D2NHR0_ORCCI|nr:Protein LMBR1L [Orchesella cincta]